MYFCNRINMLNNSYLVLLLIQMQSYLPSVIIIWKCQRELDRKDCNTYSIKLAAVLREAANGVASAGYLPLAGSVSM